MHEDGKYVVFFSLVWQMPYSFLFSVPPADVTPRPFLVANHYNHQIISFCLSDWYGTRPERLVNGIKHVSAIPSSQPNF